MLQDALVLPKQKISNINVMHHIIMWMLSAYLLVDIISGFFVIQLGVDLKLSLLYKMPLFLVMLLMIALYQLKFFMAIFAVITLLFVTPAVEFFRSSQMSFFATDIGYIIKLLMPLTVFIYLSCIYKIAPHFTEKWIRLALWSNFSFLLFNLGLGALGFGRSSYVVSGDEGVGSNGFIYAANELGPTFIVLFGFVLHTLWNGRKKIYFSMAVLTLLCGVLVATKTAMFSAFLLVFLIPVFNERQLFFKFTWLKFKMFLPAIIMVIALIIYIIDFLEALGLYDKLLWIFSQKGVIGILWSGRDVYTQSLMDLYFNNSTLFQQVFGQGSGGVAEHLPRKYSAEVDAVDALVWFGFFGLLTCFTLSFYFIKLSAKYFLDANSIIAPCVLLVNLLLLLLAQISGHVWMSGTLGISLGLLNAMLLIEKNTKGNINA